MRKNRCQTQPLEAGDQPKVQGRLSKYLLRAARELRDCRLQQLLRESAGLPGQATAATRNNRQISISNCQASEKLNYTHSSQGQWKRLRAIHIPPPASPMSPRPSCSSRCRHRLHPHGASQHPRARYPFAKYGTLDVNSKQGTLTHASGPGPRCCLPRPP
jgi:hypothetical protein